MQQANIINIITNKYEPQQKHRLGTVSKKKKIKKILGGLNRFYRRSLMFSVDKAFYKCMDGYWIWFYATATLIIEH